MGEAATIAQYSCWIVTDGKIGMVNQCLGLAEAIGVRPTIKTIKLRQPWHALVPYLRIGLQHAVKSYADQLVSPWPDLLIASGRISTAGSLYVKKASLGRTFTVQIQDPAIDPKHFDLIVTPEHDRLRGPNVLTTRGALHFLTPQKLQAAAAHWLPAVAHLPRPYITVTLGGANNAYSFDSAVAQSIARQLRALSQQHKASLLITPSRRTGKTVEDVFRKELSGLPVYQWDHAGDNPYLGLLGLADYVLTTSDSVNMVTEATATGKPVYILELPGGSRKFAAFHSNMQKNGLTQPFAGKLENWQYPLNNDTATVAARIRTLLDSHHARITHA